MFFNFLSFRLSLCLSLLCVLSLSCKWPSGGADLGCVTPDRQATPDRDFKLRRKLCRKIVIDLNVAGFTASLYTAHPAASVLLETF